MTDQHEPNRDLSNWIYGNIHIDDFNKGIIVVRVRGKEEIIADLENKHAIMLETLESLQYIDNGRCPQCGGKQYHRKGCYVAKTIRKVK